MAIANAYHSVNMDAPAAWIGNITIANTTQIQLSDARHVQNLYGNFTYTGENLSGGTIKLTDYFEDGQKIYVISGSYSALTTIDLYNNSDFNMLRAYIFSGSDQVSGSSQNDTLFGGAGDDTLDGGGGTDIAVFSSNFANYTLSRTPSGWQVAGATDGSDNLANIERFQFSDKKIAFDLTTNGHAGQSLQFIGMLAFSYLNDPVVVGNILSIFDQGKSMKDICQEAIDIGLTTDLAGSNSNLDLARLVFGNVVGRAASESEAVDLASYIQGSGGSMTQADFLTTVAQLELNNQHIGLLGLQNTWIEYII